MEVAYLFASLALNKELWIGLYLLSHFKFLLFNRETSIIKQRKFFNKSVIGINN